MPSNLERMTPKWLGKEQSRPLWVPPDNPNEFYSREELANDIRAVTFATYMREVDALARQALDGIDINVTQGDLAHIITGMGGNGPTADAIAAITGKTRAAALRHVQRHGPAKKAGRKQNLTGISKEYQAAWRQLYLLSGRGPWHEISISAYGVVNISDDTRRRHGGNTYPREMMREVLAEPLYAIQGYLDQSQWRFALLTCESIEIEIY